MITKIELIIIAVLFVLLLISMKISRIINQNSKTLEESLKKAQLKNQIYNLWMETIINEITITDYLVNNNYKAVGIYGMSDVGERLFQMLRKDSRLTVRFVMDQSTNILGEFVLLGIEDEIPEVDMIIVTSEYYYNDIYSKISRKCDAKIVSIKGLIGQASGRNI